MPAVVCSGGDTCDHAMALHGWARVTILPVKSLLGQCLVCGARVGPADYRSVLEVLVTHMDCHHPHWVGLIDLVEVTPVPPAPDNLPPSQGERLHCCPRCGTLEVRRHVGAIFCAPCIEAIVSHSASS